MGALGARSVARTLAWASAWPVGRRSRIRLGIRRRIRATIRSRSDGWPIVLAHDAPVWPTIRTWLRTRLRSGIWAWIRSWAADVRPGRPQVCPVGAAAGAAQAWLRDDQGAGEPRGRLLHTQRGRRLPDPPTVGRSRMGAVRDTGRQEGVYDY